MKKRRINKKYLKIEIAILSVLILILIVGLAKKSGDEGSENAQQEQTQEESDTNEITSLPGDMSSSVVITPEVTEDGQKAYIGFPCEIEGHDLIIERLDGFSGSYVEDGTNQEMSDIAMISVSNEGDTAIEYAEIVLKCEDDTLLFVLSALPAKGRAYVQEKNQKVMPDGGAVECSAVVVHKEEMEMSEKEVSVKENNDNTLTIKNKTDEMIPMIRVFYKYYDKKEKLYLGGIAFTARITELGAGEEITIQPSHYVKENSKVIRVSTYDSIE